MTGKDTITRKVSSLWIVPTGKVVPMSDLSTPDTSVHDFATWKRVLPTFVEEAQRLSSIKIIHNVYNDTVDVQVDFIGRTKDAHQQWSQMMSGGESTRPSVDVKCDDDLKPIQAGEAAIQVGSCEHNICKNCMGKNTRRRPDGLSGCGNEECLRQTASSSSRLEVSTLPSATGEENNANRPNCAVLLYVTIRFILVENNRIVRKSWESEIACTTKMKCLFNKSARVLGTSNPADYDWYIVTKNEEGKHETVKIDLEESKMRMVGCFSSPADTVDLLAAEKGIRLVSRNKEEHQ